MRATWLLALTPLIGGCATARSAAPLDAGELAFGGAAGGPVSLDAGPVPALSAGLTYGVSARVSAHAGGARAYGLTVLHAGAALEVTPPEGRRPRFMVDLTAYGAMRGGELRLLPDVSLLASWDLGPREHTLYVALDNLVQLGVEPEPLLWYPSPQAGGVLWLGPVGLQGQVGWHGMWRDNDDSPVRWLGAGDRGLLSLQAGAVIRPWRER